jgi:hypothetical protein
MAGMDLGHIAAVGSKFLMLAAACQWSLDELWAETSLSHLSSLIAIFARVRLESSEC